MKKNQAAKDYKGLMVSSTFSDISELRKIILDLLPRYGFFPIAMENDSAKDEDVIDSSLRMVKDSTVYFGIITHKYGKIYNDNRNPDKLSLTELEFEEALKLGRRILLFYMGDDYLVHKDDVETDKSKKEKLAKFKEKAKKKSSNSEVTRIYDVFNNIDDFKMKVQQSLANIQKEITNNSKEINSVPKEIISINNFSDAPEIIALKERISFLESNALDGFKLNKNYMGIIIPRIGITYKLYVYKEFTFLQAKNSIKLSIRINNRNKKELPLLNKVNLNLSAYISYCSSNDNFVNFSKCETITEISRGEEFLQFEIHFEEKQQDGYYEIDMNEGDRIAIIYTYDVPCSCYGNELVRRNSVFTDSELVCELIFPKENIKYYNFLFDERRTKKALKNIIENSTNSNESILYTLQIDITFNVLLKEIFKEKDYCYMQIDYIKWLNIKNKSLLKNYAFVAKWYFDLDFVPFLNDPDMYLKMERYINDGSPSGFTKKNNTAIDYTPYSNAANFEVNGILIDETFGKSEDFGIPPEWLNKNEILIHPEYNELFEKNVSSTHLVIPTASSRTLYISDKNCYAKLQYNKMIGRLERTFTPEKIENAINISKVLKVKFDQKGKLWNDLFFLPEIFGRIFLLEKKLEERFEYPYLGMIIRDYIPYPKRDIIDSQRRLIPSFSLFSKGYKNFFSKSIIELLFEFRKDKETNFELFIFEKIIKPVYKLYFELLIETGLHIEGHAQNILFLVSVHDNVFNINGVVIRDFESFDKDIDIIKKRGLISSFRSLKEKVNSSSDKERYMKRNSFLFDFKLGEYLITPILEHSSRLKANFDINYVINEIKKMNAKYIRELPPDFFPNGTWFSYKNELFDRSILDRPWIENNMQNNGGPPKYR